MPRKKSDTAPVVLKEPPALTPEARENQMIALAMNRAQERIESGKASDGLLIHFLKLATEKEKLERENLALQTELTKAKTDAYKSAQEVKELYEEAIAAMKIYSGHEDSPV